MDKNFQKNYLHIYVLFHFQANCLILLINYLFYHNSYLLSEIMMITLFYSIYCLLQIIKLLCSNYNNFKMDFIKRILKQLFILNECSLSHPFFVLHFLGFSNEQN